MYKLKIIKLFILIFSITTIYPAVANNNATSEQIRQKIESFRDKENLIIASANIASKEVLPKLYESRSFQPAWNNEERI